MSNLIFFFWHFNFNEKSLRGQTMFFFMSALHVLPLMCQFKPLINFNMTQKLF